MSGGRAHWDNVYQRRAETALTWFEDAPACSVALIRRHSTSEAAVIDVGGGASRLCDALLAQGYRDLTVLDLSPHALALSQARLGGRAVEVSWIVADVTIWHPVQSYDLWHDRVAFHFQTDPRQRAGYIRALAAALRPGGHAIIASFAEDGPETCSTLPVMRYTRDSMTAELARHAPGLFHRVADKRHIHHTPKGNQQPFQICVFQRV